LSKICARVVRSERPRKTVTYEGVTAVSEFAVNYLFVRDLAAAAGRASFPDWQPADEKGDEAQLLPPLRNGETAQLHDPKIEDKETRPPPRYNEGTVIEAMQNAWRFVDNEVLRERLKEAKGIGTPATRAEIIGGLKKQGFLIAQSNPSKRQRQWFTLFPALATL
jgi:DNA topoisomerase III